MARKRGRSNGNGHHGRYSQRGGTSKGRRTSSYRAPSGRAFRPGYDRTGGYYGRFSGCTNELKFKDTNIDDAFVALTINAQNLTVIVEGDGESERIGRKICVKKVHIRGSLQLATGALGSTASELVTCMIVQDKQTNGALFAGTDLLDVDVFDSFRNLANSGRFNVLWKRDYAFKIGGIGPAASAQTGEDIKWIKANLNCNVVVQYDNSASTGAITTVRTNNLYFVTISKSNIVTLVANVRIRYSD